MLTKEQRRVVERVERGRASETERARVAALALHVRRLDVSDDEAERTRRAAERSR